MQTVTVYLEETGTTEPVDMVDIRARVRGFLQEVNFDSGVEVKANQQLYLIQPAEFEAKVDSAQAAVDTMKVALELAEIELTRQENLIKDKATAQSKVDQARAARDGAKADLDAASAALDQAKLDLSYTKVTTPIGGRVGKTLIKLGNLVGEGEATHLTTVVSYDPIFVNFNISERALLEAMRQPGDASERKRDITKIKAYMRRATDKGFPFEGHLEYADLAVDQSTGTFLIRAQFPNPDELILPGLFVRVRIPMGTTEDAKLIPESAIGADQAGRFVLIVDSEDTVQRRNIDVGEKYDDLVVVVDGLDAEDRVLIEGLQRARPGVKVSPKLTTLEPIAVELASPEQEANVTDDGTAAPTDSETNETIDEASTPNSPEPSTEEESVESPGNGTD